MPFYCPYCNHLKRALKDHNYCSNAGDNIKAPKSNAFYMKSNEIYSGEHISRLSIRGVLNGYQRYRVGEKDKIVKDDNYLIVNEGQTWFSEVAAEMPVEIIVIAFHPDLLKQAIHSLTASPEKLLDDPFFSRDEGTAYFENTYPNDEQIKQLFLRLKTGIISEKNDELFFEQIHFDLLELIFQKHQSSLKKATLLPAKKRAVQKELFQRLGTAKDYMDAHLDQSMELFDISRVAALSPYHFLRLFKALYKMTPHQYLTNERMKLAHYLLQSSSKTVREIGIDAGFENHSAFGRVFKAAFGATPLQVRKGR